MSIPPGGRGPVRRWWITALADGVLAVDIGQLGEEQAEFIPWDDRTPGDALRSPVLLGRRVYFVSALGRIVSLSLDGGPNSLTRGPARLEEAGRVENRLCGAPAALGGRLVFETLSQGAEGRGGGGLAAHQRGLL